MSRPHHAPTIRDVAEHAGVSKSLVSLSAPRRPRGQ
ncbi:LacI family DNA-binding transcriptional regulator [Curtobacterium flaccumfaciens]|nr:LacI family DNA-binding transcriptional regulator [Curtobacterium flaccumfaciens]